MKKHRRILGAILSIVMAIGLFTGGGILSVFGAGNSITAEATASFYVPASVTYMGSETFTLSTGQKLVITTPNGKTTTLDASGSYRFTQLGVYTLAYKDMADKLLYTATVYCDSDAEYELRVASGGADIPTYYSPNKEFKVPAAELYYKTEDMDEFEPLDKADYQLTVTTTERENNVTVIKDISSVTAQKYTAVGNYIIVYSARLNGGDRYFTRTFDEILVQGGDFNDETNPKLTVVGVPTTASVNTKITLPKATASDNYDKNPKVMISVKYKPEGSDTLQDVKVANVDKKTGFATGISADAKAVVFDNVYDMSFYPTEKGRYEVEYYAIDDYGKQSAKHAYTILCEDRSAPMLIDIADWQIPSRWGVSVYKYDPIEESGVFADSLITFPYPEYVDNSGDKGILRVSFEIKDTVTNNTVIKFHDIYNVSGKSDNVYKYSDGILSNGYYKQDETDGVKFDKNGFVFDFKKYLDNEKHGDGFDGIGRYTIQYQARDNQNDPNITTKTYDLTLDAEYKDLIPPAVSVTFDKYIYLHKGVKFYTVPTAVVTDALSTRIKTEYTIANAAGTDSIKVSSGERLRIVRENSEIYLANSEYIYAKDAAEKDELSLKVTTETELYFSITATDNVGNVKSEGYPGVLPGDGVVKLVIAEEMDALSIGLGVETNSFAYTATDPYDDGNNYAVKFGGIATTLTRNSDKTDSENYNKFNLGSFAITNVPDTYRNFVGFELKLSGTNGIEDIDTLETFYVNGAKYMGDADKGMIVVDNIRVALSKGDYTFTIRAFDINGNSVSKSFALVVDDDQDGSGINLSSVAISTSGQVNETYTLKNEFGLSNVSANYDAARAFMVRKISGPGNFTLMGSEFTAYAQGSFVFEEGFYLKPATLVTTDLEKGAYETQQSAYDFDVDDTLAATFEVQGIMPVYSEKRVEVQLPSVIAHNKYANAIVTVTVKDADDRTIETVKITDETSANYNGYKFTPTKDGKYKVTYSASINNSSATSETYVITVGDNIAPTFTVDKTAGTLPINTFFKFKEMVVADDSNDLKPGVSESNKLDNITFTKRLILPNGEVYLIKDTGKTGAEKEMDSKYDEDGGYKLTASGEYKIEYIAEDIIGNKSIVIHEFSIVGDRGAEPLPFRVISTLLIIFGVLLIASIILYLARFQKKKIKA